MVRVEGLATSIGVLQRELDDAVCQALGAGVDRSWLAYTLGVSRATLYRLYSPLTADAEGR
jgi:hypothetical protein